MFVLVFLMCSRGVVEKVSRVRERALVWCRLSGAIRDANVDIGDDFFLLCTN